MDWNRCPQYGKPEPYAYSHGGGAGLPTPPPPPHTRDGACGPNAGGVRWVSGCDPPPEETWVSSGPCFLLAESALLFDGVCLFVFVRVGSGGAVMGAGGAHLENGWGDGG